MSATVLAYHTVEDTLPEGNPHELAITTEAFAAQMACLARTRTVVPLGDLVAGHIPNGKPVVAITFDDGYAGVLACAAPVLERHGFPATVFVPTAYVGGRNRWDDLFDPAFRVLNADELVALERHGVAVESHGHEHISYATSPIDKVENDLAQSTAVLESVLGRRPRFLAYPWGPSSPAARHVVADAGYRAAFSIGAPHVGQFAFGRVDVRPSDSLRMFQLKTSGRYSVLRYNRAASVVSALTRPVRRRLQSQ